MFTVKLAEHNFRIDNKYEYIHKICRDYIIDDDKNATVICISEEECRYESGDGKLHGNQYLESLAVYRKICELLVDDDIILFHSSAVEAEGQGVLFTGPSGTGKSTHAKLWKKYFPDKVKTVNDDKPLLRFSDSGVYVYGTPYGGKHMLQNNTSAPVKSIVVLRQAPENSIKKLSPEQAFPILLSQTYKPSEVDGVIKTLDLVNRLSKELPIWELSCNISKEAAQLCYDSVFEKSKGQI